MNIQYPRPSYSFWSVQEKIRPFRRFPFTFVRNPIERFISGINYLNKQTNKQTNKTTKRQIFDRFFLNIFLNFSFKQLLFPQVTRR